MHQEIQSGRWGLATWRQDTDPEHLRARSTGGRARRCAIFERRSDHLHMVLSEQCFSPFYIRPRKITEETFKPRRMYGPEQDARLRKMTARVDRLMQQDQEAYLAEYPRLKKQAKEQTLLLIRQTEAIGRLESLDHVERVEPVVNLYGEASLGGHRHEAGAAYMAGNFLAGRWSERLQRGQQRKAFVEVADPDVAGDADRPPGRVVGDATGERRRPGRGGGSAPADHGQLAAPPVVTPGQGALLCGTDAELGPGRGGTAEGRKSSE